MQFTSTAKITSLHDSKIGVTRCVLEDLEPLCASRELHFEQYNPATADLLADLDTIAERATHGMLPIIYFDNHGSVVDGIRIVESEQNVSWTELVGKLRTFNRISAALDI